jgi:DNA-binding GntR family transcriptional regulator
MSLPVSDDGGESTRFANELRRAILDGTFPSGHRLIEVELIEAFATTRGAVRDALVLLETEGYVTRQRNRGASVRSVSLDEAIEAIEVRALVEGMCAGKAAQSATPAVHKQLNGLAKQMKAAVSSGDIIGYERISQEIHACIHSVSPQRTAEGVIAWLRYGSTRYFFSTSIVPGRLARGLQEHLDVIRAIERNQPERAEAAMRAHFASIIEAIRNLDPKAVSAAGPAGLRPPTRLRRV